MNRTTTTKTTEMKDGTSISREREIEKTLELEKNSSSSRFQEEEEIEHRQKEQIEPQPQPQQSSSSSITPSSSLPSSSSSSPPSSLTPLEWRNLILLVLSYACTMSTSTLVVGTSAMVVLSVGGSTEISPVALGANMIGAACISLITPTRFVFGGSDGSGSGSRSRNSNSDDSRSGGGKRKIGFWKGNLLGFIGSVMGGAAVIRRSLSLLILSYVPLGAAVGIGMYLRFAAIEVVPSSRKAFAVTLVLTGGVLSAFAGPESAEASKDMVESYPFLGTFIVVAMFQGTMALLVALVRFPSPTTTTSSPPSPRSTVTPTPTPTPVPANKTPNDEDDDEDVGDDDVEKNDNQSTKEVADPNRGTKSSSSSSSLASILTTSTSFWMYALFAGLSWACMVMPMSIVRVAMRDVGFTSRQSLLTMEAHFLGMFAPGFVTDKFLIQRYGGIRSMYVAIFLFGLSTLFSLLCTSAKRGDDNIIDVDRDSPTNAIVFWMLGLIFIGIGWNVGFSSSTLLLVSVYNDVPHLKDYVQATNDFVMFLLAGTVIVSTGYIYKAGGKYLDGWRTVNYTNLGFIGLMTFLVLLEHSSSSPSSHPFSWMWTTFTRRPVKDMETAMGITGKSERKHLRSYGSIATEESN